MYRIFHNCDSIKNNTFKALNMNFHLTGKDFNFSDYP
nr:MAG TPA: hypothetical protein [Caudoviricetes sp.]